MRISFKEAPNCRDIFEKHRVKENLLRQTEMIEHHLTADTVRSIDMLNKFFKEYPKFINSFFNFNQLGKCLYNSLELFLSPKYSCRCLILIRLSTLELTINHPVC